MSAQRNTDEAIEDERRNIANWMLLHFVTEKSYIDERIQIVAQEKRGVISRRTKKFYCGGCTRKSTRKAYPSFLQFPESED